MSFLELGLAHLKANPLPADWAEQKTAARIIKGKHKPNLGHWSISKEYGRWEVREPFALRTTFGRPYPLFDTFTEACDYVAAQLALCYCEPVDDATQYAGTTCSAHSKAAGDRP